MRLPVIQGFIRRRLLVNFRVDADVMSRFLPAPFRPKLHDGHAIAGICLIRLEGIHPAGTPECIGISSENAAHRIAVEWNGPNGETLEGVFIPRRDTGSRLNYIAGGRLFPGVHHLASFSVTDDGAHIDLVMRSRDGDVAVHVRGADADLLPATSCFASLAESSRFFEGGSLGYSVTREAGRLDGLLLRTLDWRVRALDIEQVESSFFADRKLFPEGTVEFDHALVMRDIRHEWYKAEDMFTD
ncbi:MAG: hypothetical protein JWQ98_3332 [Chlorobi bacterium]|nr:hypothetical protein [Chlorobiota bacterium]